MIILGADYEHVLALAEGKESGIEYKVTPLGALYRMILSKGTFEVSEFSLSNYAMFQDRNDLGFTAIPVFPSRAFRHSTVYVRRNSSLSSFADLRGKRIGVVDYTMTAAVWLRGIMADEAGVHWSEMEWISTGSPRFPVPDVVNFQSTPNDLESCLISGEIDALVATQTTDSRLPHIDRRFRHLLAGVEQIERDYFLRTKIYPIMHTVIIYNSYLSKNPNAPRQAFDAYSRAKRSALQRRIGTTMIPWTSSHWDSVEALIEGDISPYGINDANRKNIDTLCSYLEEQRLISAPLSTNSLFPAWI